MAVADGKPYDGKLSRTVWRAEILTLLYLLCAIYRNSETSTSSGLTYFLLGGLASCFILLGIGLIYANVGVTYLDNFYIINNLSLIIDLNVNGLTGVTSFIPYSMLLIIVGLLFKISAAPFHF